MGQWMNLVPVDEKMPDWVPHRQKVIDLASEVKRRTDFVTWVDTRTAQLVFGYEDHQGKQHAVWDIELFRDLGRTAPTPIGTGEYSADHATDMVNHSKINPKQKWRWADLWKARQEQDERLEQEAAQAELVETCRRELEDGNKRRVVGVMAGGAA